MILERFFLVLIMVRMTGYMLTYGAFETDPRTPFGVRGLNRRRDESWR